MANRVRQAHRRSVADARDVDLAEELAQDALVIALERWSPSGIPENPGAWLMATAKHRGNDQLPSGQAARTETRRARLRARRRAGAGRPDLDAALDDNLGNRTSAPRLHACHPVLSPEARWRSRCGFLGGLDDRRDCARIPVPEPTIAQRIVRAKRTLAEARVRLRGPRGGRAHRSTRPSVLEVLYLIFNEGYSATAGDDWMRPALCEDALRLGRMLAELAPKEPEVHGLVALMEIQASRARARVGPSGEPILLLDQDRARWDQVLIRRGLARLQRAEQLGGALGRTRCKPQLPRVTRERGRREETDWQRIAAILCALAQLAPSARRSS